jgi:hypothetical protein
MRNLHDIYPNMDVFSADNRRLGAVSKVVGNIILLNSETAGHLPAAIPLAWVMEVKGAVRLAKSGASLHRIMT